MLAKPNSIYHAELKALLEQAISEALLQWFGMIGEVDVQEAR
jgi:hypothetical protein